MNDERTFSIVVQNEPGVLTKIAQMFYRRGYNIETLTVGKTHIPGVSKILISVPLDDHHVELLRRQIENLIDVHQAQLLDRHRCLLTEVCLMRLRYRNDEERAAIMSRADPYRPRLRDIDGRTIALEVAAKPELIDDFVTTMGRHEICDISRTGPTALGPPLAWDKANKHQRSEGAGP